MTPNPLILIIGNAKGYIEKSGGNKNCIVSTNEGKDMLKKVQKNVDQIKYLTRLTNNNLNGYDEKNIKTKHNSNDNIPVNKALDLFPSRVSQYDTKVYEFS